MFLQKPVHPLHPCPGGPRVPGSEIRLEFRRLQPIHGGPHWAKETAVMSSVSGVSSSARRRLCGAVRANVRDAAEPVQPRRRRSEGDLTSAGSILTAFIKADPQYAHRRQLLRFQRQLANAGSDQPGFPDFANAISGNQVDAGQSRLDAGQDRLGPEQRHRPQRGRRRRPSSLRRRRRPSRSKLSAMPSGREASPRFWVD